jgi:hypothetical protein
MRLGGQLAVSGKQRIIKQDCVRMELVRKKRSMRIAFGSEKYHRAAAVGAFLIVAALVTGAAACDGAHTYQLTISSASGGSVTTPGHGTFTYDAGTMVQLVATPDEGYQFHSWTGDVAYIANPNAASTTITMNGDYAILANFGTEGENGHHESPTPTLPPPPSP